MNDRTTHHPSSPVNKPTTRGATAVAQPATFTRRVERVSREFGATCLTIALLVGALWTPLALVYRIQYAIRTQTLDLDFAPTTVGRFNKVIFFGLLGLAAVGIAAALAAKLLRLALHMRPHQSAQPWSPSSGLGAPDEPTRHQVRRGTRRRRPLTTTDPWDSEARHRAEARSAARARTPLGWPTPRR